MSRLLRHRGQHSPSVAVQALVVAALVGGPPANASATGPNHGPPGSVAVSPHTRALVVAPHPDDAVPGAGGLVQRIVGLGGRVGIIEMTSGDAFSSGVAAVRAQHRTEDSGLPVHVVSTKGRGFPV